MLQPFRYIDSVVIKMASHSTDPINQTRIKMLAFFLAAYTLFSFILVFIYFPSLENIQMIRASVVFVFTITLLFLIRYAGLWKMAGHIVVSMLTFAAWSNLLLFQQGIHASTLQYIWMASALSFYVLGSRWGWFYSTINALPIIFFIGFNLNGFFNFVPGPYPRNKPVYIFAVSYNFAALISLHYFFFRRFYENFSNLMAAKNQVNELNKKLEATIKDVQKLSNERLAFLSTMSHELRTPLNGVIGISNALQEQNPRPDQRENLDILQFSANNLLSLINDILDFNKLDSEKLILENEPFELDSLLRNCFENLQLIDRKKNLSYHLFVDEEIKEKMFVGDATRLTQVLLNLLNNAVKFTDKGIIILRASVKECHENEMIIQFSIEDTGIGIPKDKQESVFNIFYQISGSQNRGYSGAGLGLAITKKILHLFGSEIKLISEQKKGTKFYFDLSMKVSEKISLQSDVNFVGLKTMKILVVDDHDINVLVIQKLLSKWDINPCIARTGFEAVSLLVQHDYDLILMDLYMPGMDGYTATEEIRKMTDSKKSNIPIIALTAAAIDEEIMNKIYRVGMNDVLPKPFSPDTLFAKIHRYAEGNSLSKIA